MFLHIGFFIRHFTERGADVAVYDYAKYNEEVLGNKSYIICFSQETKARIGFPLDTTSYNKFNNRFQIIEINSIHEMREIIENYCLDFFYTLCYGNHDVYMFENKYIWKNCKTIKHCVFDTRYSESNYYISISNYLNQKYETFIPVIPHIVDLPDCSDNLREELQISENAVVFGRYGGFEQFDIHIAQNAIIQFLQTPYSENCYFLFMNTRKFVEHPRVIYLDKNVDMVYKVKFINTCDAMIHARSDGETFGLSIAEFSIKNKPIITCPCGDLEHIMILGNKGLLYTNQDHLIDIFKNIKNIINKHKEEPDFWNCYKLYTPTYIMNLFKEMIFDNVGDGL